MSHIELTLSPRFMYREFGLPFKFDVQRFGTYEDQVKSHGGSGNIKPNKIIKGHERTPRQIESFNIVDYKDYTGRILRTRAHKRLSKASNLHQVFENFIPQTIEQSTTIKAVHSKDRRKIMGQISPLTSRFAHLLNLFRISVS